MSTYAIFQLMQNIDDMGLYDGTIPNEIQQALDRMRCDSDFTCKKNIICALRVPGSFASGTIDAQTVLKQCSLKDGALLADLVDRGVLKLNLTFVSWQDVKRSKNSSLGPWIMDIKFKETSVGQFAPYVYPYQNDYVAGSINPINGNLTWQDVPNGKRTTIGPIVDNELHSYKVGATISEPDPDAEDTDSDDSSELAGSETCRMYFLGKDPPKIVQTRGGSWSEQSTGVVYRSVSLAPKMMEVGDSAGKVKPAKIDELSVQPTVVSVEFSLREADGAITSVEEITAQLVDTAIGMLKKTMSDKQTGDKVVIASPSQENAPAVELTKNENGVSVRSLLRYEIAEHVTLASELTPLEYDAILDAMEGMLDKANKEKTKDPAVCKELIMTLLPNLNTIVEGIVEQKKASNVGVVEVV